MIILHDGTSGDLSHIQAMAKINEGFALFDYVKIEQIDKGAWIGQIVQPNQNISTVGGRLDPTILHGLQLMQAHENIQSTESVQIYDILLLGQYENSQLLTPRLRPLPGAKVIKLMAADTMNVIGIPDKTEHDLSQASNTIGELLNAEQVPLCLDIRKFNYHIMVAGGTGSGKSNVAANVIDQASRFGKCVIVHDAKPDYALIGSANTDVNVAKLWTRFENYGLGKQGANNVAHIGFYGRCDHNSVKTVVGFRASDFYPEILASLFFTGSTPAEQNAYEGFASAADSLRQKVKEGEIQSYSLDQILTEVRRRSIPNDPHISPEEAIHEMTGKSIRRKVANRRASMPWLDKVGTALESERKDRLKSTRLDNKQGRQVEVFNLQDFVERGRIIVIDYSQMDDQSYALILSYFLRICHEYRKKRQGIGIVQLVDEAHRIFDNDSRHSNSLERAFERVMREGRTLDHSIILSLQNASQIPPRVMNNLNTKIVMRQNSKSEADAATQTMGKDFSGQSMRLGTGHALVSMFESRAVVLAQMAPSPFELMRSDNTSQAFSTQQPTSVEEEYDF